MNEELKQVTVFRPNRRYRLIKDYHREVLPLVYDAKAGEDLIFQYKALGYARFYKAHPDEDGRCHPVMMKAREAFAYLREERGE